MDDKDSIRGPLRNSHTEKGKSTVNLMESRRNVLEAALTGLNSTEVPLVTLDRGSYGPAGYTDDVGIYYFIPMIAKYFNISVKLATDLFLGSLILSGILLALVAFWALFKNPISRAISGMCLILLAYATYRYSDVYVASFFAIASIVPICILLTHQPQKMRTFLFFAWSGPVIGYCNFIRSHAGTGALLFLLAWLFLQGELSFKNKLLNLCTLFLFLSIPYLHFQSLEIRRDQFLVSQAPSYKPCAIAHPKWHSIYIGLGYLPNDYGIKYDDRIADLKAKSVKPDVVYCSREYEEVLKNECFQLAKKDPWFVLKNILFKMLKVLFKILVFANVGFFLAIFYVKPKWEQVVPYLLSGAFGALPGILAMPFTPYICGLTTLATLFGLHMICLAIQKVQAKTSMQPT